MAVSFNTIPQDLRVPLFYAEMDNSQASYFSQNQKTLLIGQMVAAGQADPGVAVLVSRTDEAKQLFGVGSMLAAMHEASRRNDAIGEIWCIPLADAASAAAAAGRVTFTGTATAAGTVFLTIAGILVRIPVAATDTAANIATAAVATINAQSNLPVTAAVNASESAQVDITAKWKGETTNDITIIHNYRGVAGGERTPAGVTLAIVAMAGGSADPDLADAVLAMGDEEYDFIIHSYTTTTNLDALALEMNDSTGRWSYLRQIYGHTYTAKRGALAALQSFGTNRNNQHETIAGFEPGLPSPAWVYASEYGSRNAVFIKADPARPTQTGPMPGVLPAAQASRFIITERQTLLNNGIATSYTQSGTVRVERAITSFQFNAFGERDASYLDSETMHTSSYVIRRLRAAITSKYPRHKLGNDGTKYGAGQAIVTPNILRGALIDEYSQMETLGIVENSALFAEHLIVERDPTDPNRVNVLFPPDLVNQLRVFALINQFRLQYPTET